MIVNPIKKKFKKSANKIWKRTKQQFKYKINPKKSK